MRDRRTAASGLSAADAAQALELRQWIEQMRARCASLSETTDGDILDDALWPDPPPGARELAARF